MPTKLKPKTKKPMAPDISKPTANTSKSSLLRHSSNFSHSQLIIFILVFALAGGYLIYRSFATAPLVATLEAEQMSLVAGSSVITDTTASSGKALLLSTNATTTGSVNFPSSVTSLSLIARGTQCNGSPTMNVSLDGVSLLSNQAVSSTSWASYAATPTTAINSGTHSLSISFTNAYTSTGHGKHSNGYCTRSLYLDVTSFFGPTPTPTPAPTVSLSATPTSVSAGSASVLTWNSTNATACTASGAWSGTQATAGSQSTGALNQTSTYNLSCSGDGGSAVASAVATVTAVVPPPSCSGISVNTSMNLASIVSASPEGTTFCVQPGAYVLTGYIVVPSNDKLISVTPRGAILTGNNTYNGGLWGHGGATGNHDVLIQGFVIQNFVNSYSSFPRSAVTAGWSWTLENNEISNNLAFGVEINNYNYIQNNFIHNNGRNGIIGGPFDNSSKPLIIDKNEISFNSTLHASFDDTDAGIKLDGGTAGPVMYVTFSNNYVHDNFGNGLWCDTACKYITYTNNTVDNNSGEGIMHEVSWDATISGNKLTNNGSSNTNTNHSCYQGNILVANSTNVEVYNNTVHDGLGSSGICASDSDRSIDPYSPTGTANLYVHDNNVYMTSGTGGTSNSGLVGRSAAYSASANNRFVHNNYYVSNLNSAYWDWSIYPLSWASWQGFSQDTAGALSAW